jgi:hypothetical protein
MPKASAKTEKSQSQKFKDVARATGCDEDEGAFDQRLRKIAKATRAKEQKPKKATQSAS